MFYHPKNPEKIRAKIREPKTRSPTTPRGNRPRQLPATPPGFSRLRSQPSRRAPCASCLSDLPVGSPAKPPVRRPHQAPRRAQPTVVTPIGPPARRLDQQCTTSVHHPNHLPNPPTRTRGFPPTVPEPANGPRSRARRHHLTSTPAPEPAAGPKQQGTTHSHRNRPPARSAKASSHTGTAIGGRPEATRCDPTLAMGSVV